MVASQVVPGWPAQSALVAHLSQEPWFAPVRTQVGFAVVGQASVELVPLSPLHATQELLVLSHTGVSPLHWEELMHPTQVPVEVSQIGVAPPHCELIVQPTQTPFEPHTPERHTVAPLPVVQGPSPFA